MQNAWFRISTNSRLCGGCDVIAGCRQIWWRNLGRFQIRCKCKSAVSDANDVSGLHRRVTTDAMSIDVRPIATSQITHAPFATGVKNFTVVSTARIVLQHDAVGGRSANRCHLPVSQSDDIPPDCTIPCEKEGDFSGDWLVGHSV
jgi:hypothetical protein